MTQPTDAAASGPSIWALLIGIDAYKAVSPLRGCVNDVETIRTLLTTRYAVPENRIRTLTDGQATRARILREFQEFLIDNPQIRHGDQILFHYSGHGSQMPVRPGEFEPDGLNETLVPHDARTEGVFDLPDKTLAALLDALAAAKGDQITVILDCCHSGSGTRAPWDPSAPRVRRVAADDRIPPTDLDAELCYRPGVVGRGAGASGWATADLPYVLLAGCRDREESNEYECRAESARAWHGALTFFTLQVLAELPEGATYAELHERVAALVNSHYRNQMPQCEGDRDRRIFGNARVQRDPFIIVRSVDPGGGTVTLAAGLVHGLRCGTKLALYPPEVRTRADLPSTPLATVAVTSVAATTAEAEVEGVPVRPVPLHARGLITQLTYTGLRQTVRLEAADAGHDEAVAELRHAIGHAGAADGPSSYLRLEDDPAALVDLRVRAERGEFRIYDPDDVLLVEGIPIRPPQADQGEPPTLRVCRALESIVRFRTVLNLHNEDSGSRLNGRVKLRLRRYVADPAGPRAEDLPDGVVGPGGELTLYFDPERKERNLYVVDVFHEAEWGANADVSGVFPHVFTFSPDYSIQRLHPKAGIQEAVLPNTPENPYPIGLQKGTRQLEFWLPPGWDASRDFVKAIVTTEETDLQRIEQKPLDVPASSLTRTAARGPGEPAPSLLQQILDASAFGESTRNVGPRDEWKGEDWTVAELTVNTVRSYRATGLGPQQTRVILDDGLALVKPEGFTGTVAVTSLGLATRGSEGDAGLRPPPGLERFPDLFQPIGRTGTRGLGRADMVVAFDVDDASRRMISAANPLRLELPDPSAADAADLIPVLFDGEDYLLAGYGTAGGGGVDIVALPPPAGTGQPTARGLARTLRLFLYKKLGCHTSDLGLRRAELRDGEVVYGAVERKRFEPGQRVALFVHGFTSDTRWMIRYPAQFLRGEVCPYDHLLTWDYETFGTGIQDNGEQLALALRQQCGFGPDDRITLDVYAHSMGALIARCAVELHGAHEMVDRFVLAGSPNLGSTLVSSGRGLVFLVTSLLNRAPLVPILGTANWTLRQLYEQGAGLADLAVDSPVLKRLNALTEPSGVPYLVLAGQNLPGEEERHRLQRLAGKVLDRTLDTVFGEQNDIAVGLSSLQSVRGGSYPRQRVEVLPCDHFHYFVAPEAKRAIKDWWTTAV